MNTRAVFFSFLVILVVAAGSFAQTGSDSTTEQPRTPSDGPWQIIFFTPGDTTSTDFINDAIGAGSIPVGLEVTPGESLGVLFARTNSIIVESWAILEYEDWNAIESEITGGIVDGFVPMDISRYRETLAVLWVKSNLVVDGWRMSTSANTLSERSRTVNEFQNQGLTLWGLSVHDDLVWYLFLRHSGVPSAGAVSAFAKEGQALQSGLLEATTHGWVPNGLASNGENFYICFIQ